MNRTLFTLASTTALALSLGLAAPAAGASLTVDDPADVKHGVDLRSAKVTYGQKNLWVVLTHKDLRPGLRQGASGSVYIDTDPADRGPELVFTGGYFEGTDYALVRTDGFGPKNWGREVDGSYRLWVDYDQDQVRMRISREILGDADEVRVSVKVGGYGPRNTTVTDWLGRRFGWTEWVASGS